MEIPQPLWTACHNIWSYLWLKGKQTKTNQKTHLVCNQNFSGSNLSAASCHVTVELQEESGSVLSRQLCTGVRSAGLLSYRLKNPSCLSFALYIVCSSPIITLVASTGLQYIHVSLVLWSLNLDVELKMSSHVVKICIKR